MISAQNHPLQLSGSKWLIYIGLVLVAGACTPKLQPVVPPKPVEQPVAKAPEVKPPVKVEPKFSKISLILPFNLDYLKTGYSSNSLKEANIAVEYYQGFKLALDSLTASGYNYKLQVYDSKDQPAQAHALASNSKIRESDLIVGPGFPVNLKAFTDMLTSPRKPIVSPLASAAPSNFKNQNLITAIPPLEYHVWAAADYVATSIKAKRVFVLRSGFSEENDYLTPFK